MDTRDPAHASWHDLVIDFTQNTTCHGVRYLGLPTRYWCIRRLIWIVIILSAAIAFTYLASIKLHLYYQYQKTVSVEVVHQQHMAFPAVTLCNLNQFRLTPMHRYGLIDALTVMNSEGFLRGKEILPRQSFGGSRYYYDESVCSLSMSVVWKQTYTSLSRQMCATLCGQQHDSTCTSILYNQTDQSCTLSSYRPSASQTHSCQPDGPMEFYLRQRLYDTSLDEIICTFEKASGPCPFKQEVTGERKEDKWLVRSAQGRIPERDLTLESGDGQYLLFPETARKPGFRARYVSPFINTTGKCLNLFYRFLGSTTSLTLSLRTPDMVEHPVSMVSGSQPTIQDVVRTDFGGKQLREQLPSGEYQVIIEARRNPSRKVTSGAVLDNLLLLDCQKLDGEDCVRSRIGHDYTGQTSRSMTGKKCVAWQGVILDDGTYYTEDMFPDRSMREAKNFCRNPGGSGQDAPYCHYRTPQGILAKEMCNITYCSCIGLDMFHCHSGLCVPRKLMCDGTDHCGDGSDEGEECSSQQSVSCEFEAAYLCGYRRHKELIAQWVWHRNDMRSVKNDPFTDAAGSTLGYYLMLDNRDLSEGDTALTTSPQFYTKGHATLTFFLYTKFSVTDVFSGFFVHLLNLQGRVVADLYTHQHTSQTRKPNWRRVSVCLSLSEGSYYIRLQGIVGEPFHTVIAVDDLQVEEQTGSCTGNTEMVTVDEAVMNSTWQGCSFESGESCDITQSGWSYWVEWQLVPFEFVKDIIYNSDTAPSLVSATNPAYCKLEAEQASQDTDNGSLPDQSSDTVQHRKCKVQLYNLEGYLMSPDFPSLYRNYMDFNYRITLPGMTNVSLSTLYMDIEQKKEKGRALCNLDYIQAVLKTNGSRTSSPRFCGHKQWQQSAEVDALTVQFHSDRSIAGRGFYLHYKVDPIPGVDYMLGLSNRGRQTNDVTQPYFSYLDFPMVTAVTHDYCLRFWALIGASLDVVMVTKDSQQLLSKIQRMLFWREYDVPIPSHDSPYYLQFRSDVVVQSTVFVEYVNFINNVSFTEGSCVEDHGSITEGGSCDFDFSLCGYTEESESFSTWRKSSAPDVASSPFFQFNYTGVSERLGKNIMLVHFDTKTDVALLRSPVITIQGQKCLHVDYLCRTYNQSSFTVSILKASRRQRLNFDSQRLSCETNSWISLNGTLPRGEYQIQIEASASVTKNAWAYFAIDNINISAGSCRNSGASYDDNSQGSGSADGITLLPSRSRGDNTYKKFNVSFVETSQNTTGPELGQIALMIKSKADLQVRMMEEETSHSIQDMILRCRWNYGACSAADFTETLTELGLCYTFNGNPVNQSTTETTGSGSGLALLLNVEQYEHLPGKTSQPGVKVFLHDPQEIAYTKYVGVAVPPGMHSLMAIKHQQSQLLDLPYGNCSTEPDPYYPDEPYTRYRCQRRCQSQYLEAQCGCVRDFMPGESQVCNLSQSLACAYAKSELTGDVLSQDCVCHEACTVTRYSVDLSYTRLSELNVDLYLSEGQQSIERHLEEATELRNRLAISEPDTLLDPLTSLRDAHMDFLQTINFHIIETSTSTVELVKEVMTLIQNQAIQEIKETLFANVTHLQEAYMTRVSSFWDAILNPVSELLTEAQKYGNLLVYSSSNALVGGGSDNYTSQEWMQFVEQNYRQLLSYIPSVLNMYIEQQQLLGPRQTPDLPIKYSLHEAYCSEKITTVIMPLLQNLSSIVEELNITARALPRDQASRQAVEGFYDMMDQLTEWTMLELKPVCVLQYQSLLQNLTEYLSGVEVSQNLLSEAIHTGSKMEQLQKDTDLLNNITTQYLDGRLAKVTLTQLLNEDYLLKIKSDMEDVYSSMRTGLFQPLESLSQQLPVRLSQWYSEALTLATQLGDFLQGNSSYLEHQVRAFEVWRKPRPDLQNPELLTYSSSKQIHSWPQDKDLAQFQDSGLADFLLRSIFQEFFAQLRKELSMLETTFENQLQQADVALQSIHTHLVQFEEKVKVTGDFVRDNFVDMNIFYGELKYDSVHEQPAYDIPTFFSDMGGFMGLLLGMSVITLCEVLDLLIYNMVVKLTVKGHKRYKESVRKRKSRLSGGDPLNHVDKPEWRRRDRPDYWNREEGPRDNVNHIEETL